jgi:hypothetical protein
VAKIRLAVRGSILGLILGGVTWAQAPAVPPMALAAAAPAVTKVFPLVEVHKGLHGVAYTVFEGVDPEPMPLVILGVLKDAIGPGQDMILARLEGAKAEYTGVVAGMSGSPVYIDGRLVGALSYRIGQFSKEPICGITPIEAMFAVRDRAVDRREIAQAALQAPSALPGARAVAQDGSYGGLDMQPIETPLVFGGFSRQTLEQFGDRFRAMGLTPVAGLGGADATAKQPEALVPGSAVSAVLVRGDLSMAGTCTVTYIDPKRLLACGHPITQYGPVDMPMTKAEVVATLPSPLNAFKIVNTTETVGAFTDDRESAIMGQFGVTARMIPVEVEVTPAEGSTGVAAARTFHFEVLDNRQLTPQAMLVSVYQTLQATNAATAEMSYRLSGEMDVKGLPPVSMDGMMALTDQNPGAINAALFVGERFMKVYSNAAEQPIVTGLRLKLEAIPERRTAVIDSARLSMQQARAGDTVEVEAVVHPYQAEAHVMRLKVKLPISLTPGPLRVLVSDGATVDRLTAPTATPGSAASRSAVELADAVAELNATHENDTVYVTLLDHAAQAVLESGPLQTMPISMVNVMGPLKESQKMQLTGESVVAAGQMKTGYAVSGSQVLTLTIQ